jgi:hypothetical protein
MLRVKLAAKTTSAVPYQRHKGTVVKQPTNAHAQESFKTEQSRKGLSQQFIIRVGWG